MQGHANTSFFSSDWIRGDRVGRWPEFGSCWILGGWGGVWGRCGVRNTTLCVFNQFGPFSIPLIWMNICLLSLPSIILWQEVKIEAVAGWNSLFKFTCYILSLHTHHTKDHFQRLSALTFHIFHFCVPRSHYYSLSAICLPSQYKEVVILILESVVWQTAAVASWFSCSSPSANECVTVLWLQSDLFPLLTGNLVNPKFSSAEILLKVHAQADIQTHICALWQLALE